jgi:hypothetical protein
MFEKPLSPTTQAVSDAIKEEYLLWEALHPGDAERIAAAALRAAANLLNQAYANEEYVDSADEFLCDIATELEETK